ncbi:MAG TPA: LD-carboxypeptidase [Cytophagaceae bacterium]|nr:LD-carboxypeptidase [Cytophagaceae bacterium]
MSQMPAFLQKNDLVAIVATAKNFEKKELASCIQQLKDWGLQVVEGKHLYEKADQFAGTDEQRLEDLQWALDTKEIKAVFCARGGYGTGRIIDEVNWKKIIKSPKWVVGFSDVTVLLAQLEKNDIQSIHGLMPISFGNKAYDPSIKKLKETLFGKPLRFKLPAHPLNRTGEVTAALTGGNLAILCSILETNSAVNMKNKILFLEDVGENLYRVDRMIVQLKRAGILKALSGLIVGHFTNMEDNPVPFGKTALEIIANAVKEYKYPVCYGFPTGHEPDNFPLILGATIKFSVKKNSCTIDF